MRPTSSDFDDPNAVDGLSDDDAHDDTLDEGTLAILKRIADNRHCQMAAGAGAAFS